MQENQQHANAELDSANAQLATEQQAATQETQQQSSNESNVGHDDVQNNGQEPELAQTGSNNSSEPDIQVLKKEYGKLKQTQEELRRADEERKALIQWTLKTPERTRDYLIETEGRSPEEADRMISQIKAAKPELWANSAKPIQPDPYVVAQQAVRQELETREYFNKMFSVLPEISPSAVKTEDDKQRFIDIAGKVDYAARSLMVLNPQLKVENAWKMAYKAATGSIDEEILNAKEEGLLEGLQKANSKNTATFSSPTPSNKTKAGSVNLTKAQKEIADMGIQSGLFKDYAEYLQYSSDETE